MEIKIADMKLPASVLLLHLLTNFHIHLNSYPLPLPLTVTASVVELFATVDNSSDTVNLPKHSEHLLFTLSKHGAEASCGNDCI